MTVEEKKAIEITKTIIEFAGDSYIPKENRNALQTLLNLIEKQQKEIEQQAKEIARQDRNIHKLNLDKIQQQKEIECLNVIHESYKEMIEENNYISKDKIREKIKELEGQEDWYMENKSLDDLYGRIDMLQELLEE